MRAFIAIELPAAVQESLTALVERLRLSGARLSWVKPEGMHLTLRFLGDVEPERIERIREHLTEALEGASPFGMTVRGLGAFPNPRRPSVLWAGIEPHDGELLRVQGVMERAAQAIGLAPETKAFHPHLTLARIKDPAEAAVVMPYFDQEIAYEGGSFTANSAILFSSTLTPRGPIHRPIQEFPFR